MGYAGLRGMAAAGAIGVMAAGSAAAQAPAATQGPRPIAPAPPGAADPSTDEARAAFEQLSEGERVAIQDALVWTGDYNSTADGSFGRRTFEAIVGWQRRARQPATGRLDRPAMGGLVQAGLAARNAAGFALLTDTATGIRVGVPARLLPKRTALPNGAGTRFQSPDGKVTLDLRALPGDASALREMYDKTLAANPPGRSITYKLVRPDGFVISGDTAGGRFFLRSGVKDGAIRGLSLGYDKGLAAEFDRVTVAISNSFTPFPDAAPPPPRPPAVAGNGPSPADARPPANEARGPAAPTGYTGFAVAARRIAVPAAVAQACSDPSVDGAPARVASLDREHGVAWLEPSVPHRVAAWRLASAAAAPAGGSGMVVFAAFGEGGRIQAVPAELAGERRVYAPLQEGAVGGVVLDPSGAVAGLVESLAEGRRAVAGLVPPASHAIRPAADLRAALGPEAPALGAPTSGGLGAVAAGLAPALARIGCGATPRKTP